MVVVGPRLIKAGRGQRLVGVGVVVRCCDGVVWCWSVVVLWYMYVVLTLPSHLYGEVDPSSSFEKGSYVFGAA